MSSSVSLQWSPRSLSPASLLCTNIYKHTTFNNPVFHPTHCQQQYLPGAVKPLIILPAPVHDTPQPKTKGSPNPIAVHTTCQPYLIWNFHTVSLCGTPYTSPVRPTCDSTTGAYRDLTCGSWTKYFYRTSAPLHCKQSSTTHPSLFQEVLRHTVGAVTSKRSHNLISLSDTYTYSTSISKLQLKTQWKNHPPPAAAL